MKAAFTIREEDAERPREECPLTTEAEVELHCHKSRNARGHQELKQRRIF